MALFCALVFDPWGHVTLIYLVLDPITQALESTAQLC